VVTFARAAVRTAAAAAAVIAAPVQVAEPGTSIARQSALFEKPGVGGAVIIEAQHRCGHQPVNLLLAASWKVPLCVNTQRVSILIKPEWAPQMQLLQIIALMVLSNWLILVPGTHHPLK